MQTGQTQTAMLQWLAIVSHELRTPLTAILGTIDRLGTETAPDKQQDHLESLTRASALMRSVIDDILDFSKLEHGAMPLNLTSTDLAALCAGTAALYRPLADTKQLHLSCMVDDVAGPWMADEYRLQQVLGNLVANAIKFTTCGEVAIRARVIQTDGNTSVWRFEVQDSGSGIAGTAQDRLFTPYMQASAATAAQVGGSGLGLSICRQLIEAMGGRIGLSSHPAKGSLFWFEIALTQDIAVTDAVGGETQVAQNIEPLHILLAEDNDTIRHLTGELLENAGHRISHATNGVEVLTLLDGRKFDAILMDARMPVLDGLQTTSAIRNLQGPQAHIPIVALTADPRLSSQPEIASLRFFDILIKPVQPGDLMRVLMRLAAVRADAIHALWDNKSRTTGEVSTSQRAAPNAHALPRETGIRPGRGHKRHTAQRHHAHIAQP